MCELVQRPVLLLRRHFGDECDETVATRRVLEIKLAERRLHDIERHETLAIRRVVREARLEVDAIFKRLRLEVGLAVRILETQILGDELLQARMTHVQRVEVGLREADQLGIVAALELVQLETGQRLESLFTFAQFPIR